jgi:hypothetical protein
MSRWYWVSRRGSKRFGGFFGWWSRRNRFDGSFGVYILAYIDDDNTHDT